MSYEVAARVNGALVDAFLFYQDQRTTPTLWPFTSAERGFTMTNPEFPDGILFAPDAGLRRSAIEGTNETQAAEIKITVAHDNPVAEQWKQVQPEWPIWLKLYRVNILTTRAIRAYVGQVVNGEFHDDVCELTVTSLKGLLQKRLPLKAYSRTCNNQLYDRFCDITDANFRATATVRSINGRDITILYTAHTIATWPVASGYFTGGVVRRDTTDSGGREMIAEHLATTGAADGLLTMLQKNSWLQVGDSIILSAGCNRDYVTCISKFDNIRHFMGFPFIPKVNPYTDGVN